MDTPSVLGHIKEVLGRIEQEASIRFVGAPKDWGPLHALAAVAILSRGGGSQGDPYRKAFNDVAAALHVSQQKKGSQ